MKLIHLAAAVLTALALTGCQMEASELATPEQRERLEAAEEFARLKTMTADDLRAEIVALSEDLWAQRDALDAAQLEAATAAFVSKVAEWEAANIEAEQARASEVAVIQEILDDANPLDALLPWVPQPYREPVATFAPLVALFFPRVRENLKAAARSTADGAWLRAARSLVASVSPFLHTNDRAEDVADAAASVAKKQGKLELAAALEEAIKAPPKVVAKPDPIEL